MNRRTAAAACVLSLLAAGCGGGGGGRVEGTVSDSAAAGGASPAPAPGAFAATGGIALWGDSMIPGISRAFTYMWQPTRDIFDGGIAGQTSAQIAARVLADTVHRDWTTLFWMGHNNDSQPEQIKADIAASVAHLAPGNNRFIVLSVLNKGDGTEDRGSPLYDVIAKLNTELAAAYPNNFLDIRGFMVSQSDPAIAQQADDLRRDLPSSALRFDGIHLTGSGDEVVGTRLIDFMRSRGW